MTRTTLRYLTPLALALALAACAKQGTTNTTTSSDMTVDNGVAANTMATVSPAQTFADTAAKSDAFEVAAAKLAQTNASAAAVKAYATKMIAAHTESTAKIKKAAAAASPAITPDAMLTDDQTAKLADLGKLKGADFDKAYVSGQVDAHTDALTVMKAYAANGDAPTLKTAASEIVPVVQDHLVMVRALNMK